METSRSRENRYFESSQRDVHCTHIYQQFNNNQQINHKAMKRVILQPGMYVYSLVVDGQIVDSKRMILTN